MSNIEHWRARLRAAVDRTGKKHSYIAECAGIAPATLSRILTGKMKRPSFEAVVSVAHAAGETVGAILGERGYELTAADRAKVREIATFLESLTRE